MSDMYKIKFKDIDKKVLIGLPFGLMALLYLVIGLAHSTKNFTSFTLDRMVINDIIALFFPLGHLFYLLFTKKYKRKIKEKTKIVSISITIAISGLLIMVLGMILRIYDFKYNTTVMKFGAISCLIAFILMFVDSVKKKLKT